VRERERERKGSYILKHKNFDEKKNATFFFTTAEKQNIYIIYMYL